jgi:hypothetical protein
MPDHAQDGKIVCFFRAAQKFNTRYATLGFNDSANLDEGTVWPTAFALKESEGRRRKVLMSAIRISPRTADGSVV